MSPEQSSLNCQVSRLSDIYSLGATLYYVLTGKLPFPGDTIQAILKSKQSGNLIPPTKRRKGVPPPLSAISMTAMSNEPTARYQSALQLADDIERWLAGESISVYPDSIAQQAKRWARKHRHWVLTAALSFLFATASLILASITTLESNRKLRNYSHRLTVANAAEIQARQLSDKTNAKLALERALMLCEQDKIEDGLLWYVEAIRLANSANDYDLESAARFGLAEWRGEIRRIEQCVSLDQILTSFAVDQGGIRWIAGSNTGKVQAWNSTSGELDWDLDLQAPITSIACSEELIYVGLDSQHLPLVTLNANGKPLSTSWCELPQSAVTSLGTANRLISIGFRSGDIHVYSQEGTLVQTYKLDTPILSIALSESGEFTIAGAENAVTLFDNRTGKTLRSIAHEKKVQSVAFSKSIDPKKLFFASGSQDCYSRVFDFEGAEIAKMRHEGFVLGLQFDSTSKRLFTASGDRCVRSWDIESRQLTERAVVHSSWAKALSHDSEADVLITASADGNIRRYGKQLVKKPFKDFILGIGLRVATWHPNIHHLLAGGVDFQR